METILECFFDNVFSDLDRGCLIARYKRRQLVDYFSTIIQGCCSSEEDCSVQAACKKAVSAALKFHEMTRDNNGSVCLLGKYHNVLYVAVKICFDWKLEDSETVVQLLKDIYICEKTFERLFVGAIFGTRVTHLISGWKSDFQNREENLKAVLYFLEHATKLKLAFVIKGKNVKFIDVPMESYGRATPLRVAVQAGQSEAIVLLLRYGATISPNINQPSTCALQPLLQRINLLCYQKPEEDIPEEFLCCLQILLTELPYVPSIQEDPFDEKIEYKELHPVLLQILYNGGHALPDLKYICRCSIRDSLRCNYQLPYGIQKLPIPDSLKEYLMFQ